MTKTQYLSSPSFGEGGEHKIAYQKLDAKTGTHGPGIIWCGGLKSDMEGSKATALQGWAG